MATILADLSVLDYDLDLEEIPFSQILLEIRYDGTTVKIPLEQCKYESKGVTYDVDSFLTFRKQFDKGAIFYNGLNLPPRASYDASDLRYVFERSGYVDTADAVNLYGDDVVITDKEVRPTPVNFGNERTITMSEINTGFVTRKATLSSLATREQVEQMKRRIPLGDKYVLVLLDGDQNPQYVRASEISYQLSLDGENWSNSEQISLDGTRGAELYDKLRRGQARLMYNGRYISFFFKDFKKAILIANICFIMFYLSTCYLFQSF